MRGINNSIARSLVAAGIMGGGGGAVAYDQLQRNVFGASLIQQIPMLPTTQATDKSGNNRNGTASNIVWDNTPGPFGFGAPLFSGTGYIDLYSASLAAAWTGLEFTLTIWAKVYDAAAWSDNTARRIFTIRGDDNNQSYWQKHNNANIMEARTRANATDDRYFAGDQNSLLWRMYTVTAKYSVDAQLDLVCYYINKDQVYQHAGVGVWQTALNSYTTGLGQANKAAAPYWYGWLQYWSVGNRALTPAEVASLYVNPTVAAA